MKRIMTYIPGATFGGAHNQALRLADSLSNGGYSIVAILPNEPGDAARRLEAAGIETHCAPLRRLRATRHISTHYDLVRGASRQVERLRGLMRELRIDLVQIHGITCIDGASASRREGLPLVWQLIDTRAPPALRAALVPYVRRSRAVVMTTGSTIQARFPGLRKGVVDLISFYPPVDTAEFRIDANRRRCARASLGIPQEAFAIICLANLNPQKDLDLLLRAASAARAQGYSFALRVRGSESPAHPGYLGALRRLAAELGLERSVIDTMPPALNAASFMNAGDLFVLASKGRSEGVPTVILEAMASGLPIIASRVGGVVDAMADGVGRLVPPGDLAALTRELCNVMEWPESRRKRAGSLGVRRAVENFGIERCAEVHTRAYNLACARGRA